MTPTLLLDLDNTLLKNDMRVFLPAYFRALTDHFSAHMAPENLFATLTGGMQAMMANQNPGLTLQRVFENHAFRTDGIPKDVFGERIQVFYAEVFPRLASTTQPWPAAKTLVEAAQARGYRIAITTNPLFSRVEILNRLAWAGLPAEAFPFELISSYEDFHFAKPRPDYLAEVMARLGWPDEPVVVVGDDPKNDIEPAKILGLASFQVCGGRWSASSDGRHACGGLEDVLPWMDSVGPESLLPEPTSPAALLAVLRSAPAALKTIFRRWEAPAVARPALDEWSLTEITCHLRDVELEVNLPRIKQVLAEDNPHLTGRETDSWAEERNYLAQECLPAIETFLAARRETLELLEAPGDSVWERRARHTIFGPTNLLELMRISAGHDRLHFRQIYDLKSALAHQSA